MFAAKRMRLRTTGLSTALVITLLGLVTASSVTGDAAGGAVEEQQATPIEGLLRDAVNRARTYHGLPPVDLPGIPVVELRGHRVPPPVYAVHWESDYAQKTELYRVIDGAQDTHLDYVVAVAEKDARSFVLGEGAPPAEVTAFLAYEGKVASGYFTPKEALKFMDFWAECLPLFEANVFNTEAELRQLYLLSGHTPEQAERSFNQMWDAIRRDGIRDPHPRIYELDGFRHYEMTFFAADALVEVVYQTVVKFRASSFSGKGPAIEALSVRTIGEHASPLERLKREQADDEQQDDRSPK